MVAGGVLSWMVLLPLLTIMGAYMPTPFPPAAADGLRIVDMAPGQIWSQYIRYIGAGAVLAAGLITLARTIPTIIGSFRDSVKDFRAESAVRAPLRTERELPAASSLADAAAAVFLAVAPGMPTRATRLRTLWSWCSDSSS